MRMFVKDYSLISVFPIRFLSIIQLKKMSGFMNPDIFFIMLYHYRN